MAKIYRHIYLSPHFDDAALSCGGMIHRQTQAGQTALVVTVCAAPPPAGESLSVFAQQLHQSWDNPNDMVAARQAEDQAALAILGADSLWLTIPDCIYRGQPQQAQWYYNNDDELFGEIHPDEVALADKIAAMVAQQVPRRKKTTVYAPLAVGHHVDHQLTHAAAWQLRRQGWKMVFYEDYPYVDSSLEFGRADLDTVLARVQPTHPLRARRQTLSEENLQAKAASINAYVSQLRMLFGDHSVESRVRDYAWRVGKKKLAERAWLPG